MGTHLVDIEKSGSMPKNKPKQYWAESSKHDLKPVAYQHLASRVLMQPCNPGSYNLFLSYIISCVWSRGGQRTTLIQFSLSTIWILGIELRFLACPATTFTHWVISFIPLPCILFFRSPWSSGKERNILSEEMAKWFKVNTALAKGQSSVLSTHFGKIANIYIQALGDLTLCPGFLCMNHILTPIYI